jgi:hypothetical protein
VVAIRLHDATLARTIAPENVYFSFASGRLGYDCVSCNAQCCRGHGYTIQAWRELRPQIERRPAMRWFLEPSGEPASTSLAVRNCMPGCFFLTESGLCEVQRDHGHDAKPETCRLFPFNNFKVCDGYLIVAPHSGLCPLSAASATEYRAESDHQALIEAMAAHGIFAKVPTAAPPVGIASLVELERRIVSSSEAHLASGDYVAFAIDQATLTTAVVDDRATREADASRDVMRYLDLLHRLLGTSPGADASRDAAVTHTLIALTPALRAHLALPSTAQPLPGNELDRLPRLLLALQALAGLAVDAGMRHLTCQSLLQLFFTNLSLLQFLARADRHLMLAAHASPAAVGSLRREWQSRYLDIFRALLPARMRRRSLAVGEIVCAAADLEPVERTLFIKRVAQLLDGQLVPCTANRTAGVRARLRQWIVDAVDDDTILALAHRRLRPAPWTRS